MLTYLFSFRCLVLHFNIFTILIKIILINSGKFWCIILLTSKLPNYPRISLSCTWSNFHVQSVANILRSHTFRKIIIAVWLCRAFINTMLCFISRLTEAHKTAIRVIRRIRYFVARRKFQVNLLLIIYSNHYLIQSLCGTCDKL